VSPSSLAKKSRKVAGGALEAGGQRRKTEEDRVVAGRVQDDPGGSEPIDCRIKNATDKIVEMLGHSGHGNPSCIHRDDRAENGMGL